MTRSLVKHKLVMAGMAITVFSAIAQDESAPILTNQLLDAGGIILKILIALSILAVCMTVYFLLTIRRGVLMPESFQREAEDIAGRGDVEALHTICNESTAAGARIIGAAARILHENPHVDYMAVRDVVEGEGSRQSGTLWQRIQYLQDIAIVSPMLGLLGTVVGMLRAFLDMQKATGIGGIRPVELASGVSQALVTTAGGLIVGIMAMIVYAFFRGRVNRVVTQLEENCSFILQRFMFKSRGERLPEGRPLNPSR